MPDAQHDRIRITGIAATGHHGVFDHERRDGQRFVADVVLHVDTRSAAAADRLDLTVDYGTVASRVAAVLSGAPADLVETVAERIAAVVLDDDRVHAVDVVLHKPQAPIPVPFDDVTVEIHRDRARPPAVAAPSGGRHAGAAATEPDTRSDVAAPPDLPGPAAVHDRLDEPPAEPVDVVLALGSNLGPSQDLLRRAVHELCEVDGLDVVAVSPLVRTAAVGGPEQPDYLNAVVLGRTTLAPRALLRACQGVEASLGRERLERWGPRTVDVDVVVHGTTLAVTDDLELPHPRAHERAFVLEPWAQVAPDAVLPGLGGGPVRLLAETAPDRGGIRWMALDWWRTPGEG
ncbi:2-amino-4-hydroxy-6-hydroxymethyldihydropteridine diphosphokinase [Actinotalea sp. AC32]|nr:2-amino-4-hydroxy-6-hydroxymethyldihydropteridine diphosphokinase [Actinotalea sp. AC32]